VQFKVVVFTSVNSLNRGNALLLCTKLRIENGVRPFGFPTDDERTENGAIYKPEVSSLHDLVSNSTDRPCMGDTDTPVTFWKRFKRVTELFASCDSFANSAEQQWRIFHPVYQWEFLPASRQRILHLLMCTVGDIFRPQGQMIASAPGYFPSSVYGYG